MSVGDSGLDPRDLTAITRASDSWVARNTFATGMGLRIEASNLNQEYVVIDGAFNLTKVRAQRASLLGQRGFSPRQRAALSPVKHPGHAAASSGGFPSGVVVRGGLSRCPDAIELTCPKRNQLWPTIAVRGSARRSYWTDDTICSKARWRRISPDWTSNEVVRAGRPYERRSLDHP